MLTISKLLVKARMCDYELREWRKDAADILLSKLNVCSRCVLCICGCRSASLFALSEPDLRVKIQNFVGSPPIASEQSVCSMCLGILSHAESPATLNAITNAISTVGYDTASVSAYMLSLSVPASACIRQHVICLHLHALLQEKLGSEVSNLATLTPWLIVY